MNASHSVLQHDADLSSAPVSPADGTLDGDAPVTRQQAARPSNRSRHFHKRPWWRMLHDDAVAHRNAAKALFCEEYPTSDVATREAAYHATMLALATTALTYCLGKKGTLAYLRAEQLKARRAS